MSIEDFKPQLIVKDKSTGQIGITCPDLLNCCTDDEIPVVFAGSSGFQGTDFRQLEIVGPENAIADLKKCGAGMGENTCIFLTVSENGVECQRFGYMRFNLIFRKDQMRAKREPVEFFPACQLNQ